MANNYTTVSKKGIEYLCSLINQLANVSEGIDDLNLRTDGTFSSVKIDTLLNTLKTDCNEYTDRLVANLSRLELKIATSESEITQPNTMYLYKPSGSTSYEQYVVIEGTKVLLGTTDINMGDYYTISQTDAKFCLITDYETLRDEVNAIKDTIGTETLTTTSTTITGAINEVKTSVPTDDDIKSLADGQITANSVDYVSSYVDKSLIPNMSLIESTYFGSYVPSNVNRTDDPNETTLANIRTKHANCPTDTMEYIIFTIIIDKEFGSGVSFNDIAEKKQIAIASMDYDDIYVRSHAYNSATWTKWKKVCTTSIADVPKTNITFDNTTNYSVVGNESQYFIKNGICTMVLHVKCNIPVGWVTVANIPKARDLHCYQQLSNLDGTGFMRCSIRTNGKLELSRGATGTEYIGTFSYPVAES